MAKLKAQTAMESKVANMPTTKILMASSTTTTDERPNMDFTCPLEARRARFLILAARVRYNYIRKMQGIGALHYA
jgi:hypothetical protein